MPIRPLEFRDGSLFLLDQRQLPGKEIWVELRTWSEVATAITDMVIRGAPAIGVAAAYGMALAAKSQQNLLSASAGLAASRPTAVNLSWALERIARSGETSFEAILAEAVAIEAEDWAMNLQIGQLGSALVPNGAQILTICNTGSLATAGHGTALGIVRSAWEAGKVKHVWSCETRPRLQGLRLTAWELMQDGIPFHSIADSVAASLMAQGQVDVVVAGADRIAANGDTANKIGTLMLAVLANFYEIPFVIAAPSSTLDPTLPDGGHIPIEERGGEELTNMEGISVGPKGCPVWNPAFDVTPGSLISAIVTEKGVSNRPYQFLA